MLNVSKEFMLMVLMLNLLDLLEKIDFSFKAFEIDCCSGVDDP